jgi:hypothetical protein
MLLAFSLFGPQKVDIDVPIVSLAGHHSTLLYAFVHLNCGFTRHLLNQPLAFVECFRANSTAKLLHYKTFRESECKNLLPRTLSLVVSFTTGSFLL